MCCYDRVWYYCSRYHWSAVWDFCEEESQEKCKVKRFRKHIYPPHGRPCPTCGFNETISIGIGTGQWRTRPCEVTGCFLSAGHILTHQFWNPCPTDGCYLGAGHLEPHRSEIWTMSNTLAIRLEENRKKQKERALQILNFLVLNAMRGLLPPVDTSTIAPPMESSSAPLQIDLHGVAPHVTLKQRVESYNATATRQRRRSKVSSSAMTLPDEVYLDLDLLRQEIRLFELFPETEGRSVQGVFHHVRLSDYPSYTALSYTWGDPTDPRKITVHGAGTLEVRKNLWEFLRRQSSMISQPKLFWVDALCINQSNVHERNHQVNLMRDIYDEAREVYIWLGTESTNSNIAMDYVKTKGTRKIRSRGAGFHAIWTREEGRALRDLCERPYWRRMWVIQEIVHARRIMVWCGEKSFTWGAFESLYLTLKILEDTHWFPHHEFSIEILQSSAAVTAWQRAHWRHPETPAPSLRTLLEVFRHWQCADIRDKIFALVSMASSGTTIVPDYSLPSRDLYFAVRERNPDEGPEFENMLSQVLGLSDQDVELSGRDLIDYKIHPPDKFLLRKRINDDWGNNCVGSEY